MNPGDEGLGEVVKDLMTRVRCHHCGEHFQTPDIKVIGHDDNMWFLKVSCQACSKVSLTVVFVSELAQPQISEIAGVEEIKFRQYPVASGDDLLDMHSFLKDFDGDFTRIFSEDNGGVR
ncbi:MAG: hypothetical protein WC369_06285 [Dehalococcoidales bacterium]|jgi:hypothetical protein